MLSKRLDAEESARRLAARPPRPCSLCGSPFQPSKSGTEVCSRDCRGNINERRGRVASSRKLTWVPPDWERDPLEAIAHYWHTGRVIAPPREGAYAGT